MGSRTKVQLWIKRRQGIGQVHEPGEDGVRHRGDGQHDEDGGGEDRQPHGEAAESAVRPLPFHQRHHHLVVGAAEATGDVAARLQPSARPPSDSMARGMRLMAADPMGLATSISTWVSDSGM